MRVSATVQFSEITSAVVNILREFQRKYPEIKVVFTYDFSTAIIRCRTLDCLAKLIRLTSEMQTIEGC